MKTYSDVSELENMKSYSEGVILPSEYDTKVSASNLKREISGKYLSTTTSKITKVTPSPSDPQAKRSSRKNQRRFRNQEEEKKRQME